ncbi:MAG: thioredoxin-like domain-containing protein [Bacteroidales bacterium]|nr:thioredoxin-like domain-containing protein [Bacteroidales bacterium]
MIRSVILVIALIITNYSAAQESEVCNILFDFESADSSFISLAYHLGDKQYIKDTLYTDLNGDAVLRRSEPLEKGLYMVVFPDNNLFEVIIANDQQFKVSCDRNDIINSLHFEGSEENTAFIEYRKKWRSFQEKTGEYRQKLSNLSNQDSINTLRSAIKDMEDETLDYIRTLASDHEGTLLSAMLYSMLPVRVPDFNIPDNVSNRDSVRWIKGYIYNKNHFFDNVDLGEPGLIRTPILHNKLKTFFSDVIIQAPDSVISEIRTVLDRAGKNPETFRFTLSFLFNHYRSSQIMGHDAIIVMLADEYYLNGKADWADKDFLESLREDVARIRPSLIGKKARDLTMQTYSGQPRSVYDIDSEFTILYFWEPNCGHCKESTPLLKEFYNKNRDKGVEIYAVCTQDNKEEWMEYIAENGLEWINGWDPTRNTGYDYYYNVKATPLIYVLNKDKEIIAKQLPAANLQGFIDNYRRIH